jgi:hypothetical protein
MGLLFRNSRLRDSQPEVIRVVIDDVVHAAEPAALVRLEPRESFDQLDQVVAGQLSLGLVSRREEDRRLHFLPVVREGTGIALALEQSSFTTYLCWRSDRDNPDDLGPFLALARERFPEPMDL